MQTSSATNRTYTYDLNTGGQGYINVYLEPRINQHQGQPGPQYSSTVYLYAQILFNGTGATRALSFDEIDNNEVDGNGKLVLTVGFVMMKNQLLSLKRTDHSPPLAVGNMYWGVYSGPLLSLCSRPCRIRRWMFSSISQSTPAWRDSVPTTAAAAALAMPSLEPAAAATPIPATTVR